MPVGDMIRYRSLPSAPSGRWKASVIGRVDRAGAHGVGAQALLGVLDGQRAGQREHAALRRGVGGGPGVRGQRGGGRHVHDRSAVLEQRGDGGLAHEERAREVHVQDLLPALERHLVAVLEPEDAGAVHEQVETTVLEGGGDRGGREGRIADVADKGGDRVRPGGVLGRGGQPLLGEVGGDHRGALVHQSEHGGPPDPRRSTRDERDSPLVSLHGAETRTCSSSAPSRARRAKGTLAWWTADERGSWSCATVAWR